MLARESVDQVCCAFGVLRRPCRRDAAKILGGIGLSSGSNRSAAIRSASDDGAVGLSNLLNKQVKTPLGDLPLPLAIAGGATLIWWKPDLVLKLFG